MEHSRQLSLTRYEIRGVLGRGGTGVVYEAFDTKDQSVVALKTIESTVAENLYRLKHEFRSLADVQHKNLVRFGELSCEEGQWFFTMELIRGGDFIAYVRPFDPAPQGEARAIYSKVAPHPASGVVTRAAAAGAIAAAGFDEARLRDALAQVVGALGALHEAGQVHRDIKPSNVLVTGEGRVVLLDFGLVTALAGRAQAADEPWVVGTPAFMAPEQAEGHAVGPAADWYSLGVMLFLALTGRLPFEGSSMSILQAKLAKEAPSPRSLVPTVPVDLDELCVAMMRLDPDERIGIDEIRARLGLTTLDPFTSTKIAVAEATAPFVGRDAETRALFSALEEVRGGKGGRTVIVDGEPGMGKSSLVHKFIEALSSDVLVLSGRCYEQETVPFKGIDTIVDAISQHLLALPDDEVHRLLAGGTRYLATIFPVLNRVDAIAQLSWGAREVANPSALREQAFGELERLLAALAARGALVLFLDDLQWADRDSIALLRRALWQPSGAPCLFVATMRNGSDVSPEMAEALAHAERISLSGLSDKESKALLDALWTTKTAKRSVADREILMREAGGHPLFLAELVRSARAGHVGKRVSELQQVLWERISERDPVDRQFLEMVAIAGAPTPYEIVAKAAGTDVGECQTRLGGLRAAQLIRVSRRGEERLVEPYHDRIRESVLLHLRGADGEGASLAARHLRLGRAILESTPSDALAGRIFAIVQNLNAGRDLIDGKDERVRVAELNLLASRQAQLATAYERSRDYARLGIGLLGDSPWTDTYGLARDLHIQRMVAEMFAGDAAAAKECFLVAREKITAAADRTLLHVSWIGLQTSRGMFRDAIETGRERLRELGMPTRERVTWLAVVLLYVINRLAQGRRAIADLLHLEALRDATREGAMKLLVALVPAAFFSDSRLMSWLHMQIVRLSLRYGVSDVSSYGFAGYGTVVAAVFHKHAQGEAYGRLALALNARMRNDKLAAKLHFLYGGWLAWWVRPLRDGIAELRIAHDLARKHGDTSYEAYSATVISVLSFCESADLAALEETARWANEVATRRKERDMAGVPEAHARYAAALRGTTPSARDLGSATSTDADFRAELSAKTPTAMFYYLFCNAELAYLFGDPSRARALLEEASKLAQVIFSLPTTAELCFLEALVLARLHDGAPLRERIRLRWAVARRCRRLRASAKSCAVSFEAHAMIANAELARMRGSARAAEMFFERAVTAARAHHSVKREALALDLAAAHARSRGDDTRAHALRAQASDAYRRWGAATKADALANEP